MSHAEDLQKMKDECSKIRDCAFSAMRDCLRMTTEQLKDSGSKSNEQAAINHFKYAQSQIDKLHKAYIAKYPD
jgi:hypothetical protein